MQVFQGGALTPTCPTLPDERWQACVAEELGELSDDEDVT